MQLAIGPFFAIVAIGTILMALSILAVEYWVSQRGRQMAQSLPLVGNAIGGFIDTVHNAVYNFTAAVINGGVAGLIYAAGVFHEGIKLIIAAEQYVWNALLSEVQQTVHAIVYFALPPIEAAIARQRQDINTILSWGHTFVEANIIAFKFWQGQITALIGTQILPQLHALTTVVNTVTNLTIPTMITKITELGIATTRTLPAEIAEAKTDTEAVARILARTTTAPRTGLLDRADTLEKDMAKVIPITTVLAIAGALANLARVAEDPCYCLNQGTGSDVMPLLLYLFDEAG